MSPEQAQYLETDRRSDLFSLGIVMFELLTGYHIFETDDLYETLNNVKRKRIPMPREIRKDVPEELERIIMKALERDFSRRYQSAGEMGYDLEHYMYHDRYGPTNVALGQYMRKHFLSQPSGGAGKVSTTGDTDKLLAHRADTLFGDALSSARTKEKPKGK